MREIGYTTKEGPGLLTIQCVLSATPYREVLIHFFLRPGRKEKHWGYKREFEGTPFGSFGLGFLFSIQWLWYRVYHK